MNQTKVANWEKVMDSMWTCVRDHSGSVFVVMSVRKYILQEYHSVKDINSFNGLFDEKYQMDISIDPELKLNQPTKAEILRRHIQEPVEGPQNIQICNNQANESFHTGPFQISEKTIQDIASSRCPIGFPFCCKLFVQNQEFLVKGKGFFMQPFQWLIDLFDLFYRKEKIKYLLLVCILFSGDEGLNRQLLNPTVLGGFTSVEKSSCGQLNIQMLHRFAKVIGAEGYMTQLQETENIMNNTFVSIDLVNELISFSHDVIHEAMCCSFVNKFPYLFIEDCSIELLLNYVHVDKRVHNTILVRKQYFSHLVERFIKEIERGM